MFRRTSPVLRCPVTHPRTFPGLIQAWPRTNRLISQKYINSISPTFPSASFPKVTKNVSFEAGYVAPGITLAAPSFWVEHARDLAAFSHLICPFVTLAVASDRQQQLLPLFSHSRTSSDKPTKKTFRSPSSHFLCLAHQNTLTCAI